MKGANRFPLFWVLINIPLLILLIILFTLLFSVPDDQLLFSSTYDFIIIVAKSSRVAAFLMFNVIIIIIIMSFVFVGSPKPSDYDQHQDHDVLAVQLITCALEHGDMYMYDVVVKDEENDGYYDGTSDVDDHHHGYDGYDEENDDDLDTEDDDEDSEDEEDKGNELERRIEEFIAQVTRKWREELLTETESLRCITAT